MKKSYRLDLITAVILIVLGQFVFFFLSPRYLEVSYSNRIYATLGTTSEEESNPQALAEASKQFIETMMGWMKFPNFMKDLKASVPLPEGSNLSAHPQERQNIIITLSTPQPITPETLQAVKDYLANELSQYNAATENEFRFAKLDYEQVKEQKSYKFGATATLVISLILAAGLSFLRRELTEEK